MTQISEKAGLLLPSLSRIIRKLRGDGFVVSSTNSTDRRRQAVVITPDGQKIIDDNLPQAKKIAQELRHQFGSQRYEQLLDLLAVLEN